MNIMKYQIYQLDLKNEIVRESRKIYESWDFLEKYCGGFDFSLYQKTYEGEEEGENDFDILEKLFTKFNINHPADFFGHSMSVSDVVILNGKKYYCDSIGWKEIK